MTSFSPTSVFRDQTTTRRTPDSFEVGVLDTQSILHKITTTGPTMRGQELVAIALQCLQLPPSYTLYINAIPLKLEETIQASGIVR